MPKPTKGARLGSGPTHQKMILAGLAASLIREERIRTTEAKAKRMRPLAEKLVTLGKSGDIHARRQALAVIEDRDIVHKLFAEIAPRFSERNGGYTRILKLGPRQGDAAPMAIIEFVEGEATVTTSETEEETKRRGLRRRKPKTESPRSPEAPAGAASLTSAADESTGLGESPQESEAASSSELAPSDVAQEGAVEPSATEPTSGAEGSAAAEEADSPSPTELSDADVSEAPAGGGATAAADTEAGGAGEEA